MIPKSQTIEAITKLNPTADFMFLSGFSHNDLTAYLRRLRSLRSSELAAEQAGSSGGSRSHETIALA